MNSKIVEINKNALEGNSFNLTLPNNNTITIVLVRKEFTKNGGFVWVGDVEGHSFS